MLVRPATLLDLPALRTLYVSLCEHNPAGYPTTTPADYDAFVTTLAPALASGRADFLCLVAADDDGRLLGFLAAEMLTRPMGQPRHYAAPHYLIVVPEARGRGVATALCQAAIAWAQQAWPQITQIEIFAIHGDPQWADRGWRPFLVKYTKTVAEALADLAPRPAAVVEDEATPVPSPRTVEEATDGPGQ